MIHKKTNSSKSLWDHTISFLKTQNYHSFSGKTFARNHKTYILIQALVLIYSVTLDRSFNVSDPQGLELQNHNFELGGFLGLSSV